MTRKTMIDRLDGHWRLHIKERDNWTCRKCGISTLVTLEAHHVAKRRLMPTRWEPLNGLTMCQFTCHYWAESHPDEAREWACDELGADTFNAVVALSNGVAHYTLDDLQELEQAFRDRAPVSRVSELLKGVSL